MSAALAALLLLFSPPVQAASRTILLTGYWPPTNLMLKKFSRDPAVNPEGWQGQNWKGAGYDVVALFPSFASGDDKIGTGPFRVDYASVYNDFLRATRELAPVAIVSFGQGMGPWEIEANFPNFFLTMFRSGNLPSQVGARVEEPIAPELQENVTLHSSLPLQRIAARVNGVGGLPRAWVDEQGDAGDFLCGFLGYLGAWYHEKHKNPADPAWNAAAGFIHVSPFARQPEAAVDATVAAVIESLPPIQRAAARSRAAGKAIAQSR